MEYTTLSNGVKMPMVGFGVFQIPQEQTKDVVLKAIDAGYRLFDTAQAYGNEKELGEAIRESGLPREEFFITSKLWMSDLGYEATKKAIDDSLERLGMDYMDLYLIHQPFGDIFGSWRAMVEAYKAGKLRAIGTANFQPDHLENLIQFQDVAPMVNQVETNPFIQQKKFHEQMEEENVVHEAWAPFAEGRNGIFTNPILTEIGEKYGKNSGQVILRWLLQNNVVSLNKSVHEDRIKGNIDIFDFELTDDEMKKIATIDEQKSAFFDHHDPKTVKMLANMAK
ncbi:2,5-diketo-D-gluconic acid reductase [Ligilactobacillus aviarius]|uniref:aldo/keto reductase n=1 Tax=Ligilactobacillus aviarius TaxID=1606 RepID=UPI0007D90902|nr:aldo/keto reductase [Ligilactobacillus aviarius]OAQ03687.1 2,5-diketo-D-gluconic acid reductase [Ligilactobacillus aviarius]OAQ05654.1 2,5-diketo-D-gluconic acid reductase [Ligilactobacillus aviarius]OAS79277.1 2,5-diketo-D-gluconic acid reductase [Ligilactobacillus aviarius]PEG71238.1 aldo/keto reductase [Ligilactobacillus aviarius]PEG74510.1 aldo/keto reductase [Ligilactobacillus aviarius]